MGSEMCIRDRIRGDRSTPTSAADGPGAPTLRGLGTSKHTPAEALTRRWAEGPANLFFLILLVFIFYFFILSLLLLLFASFCQFPCQAHFHRGGAGFHRNGAGFHRKLDSLWEPTGLKLTNSVCRSLLESEISLPRHPSTRT